jgi:hypothetical protein
MFYLYPTSLFNIVVEKEPVCSFINIERISIAATVTRISNKTTSSTIMGSVGTTTTDRRNIPFSIIRSPNMCVIVVNLEIIIKNPINMRLKAMEEALITIFGEKGEINLYIKKYAKTVNRSPEIIESGIFIISFTSSLILNFLIILRSM